MKMLSPFVASLVLGLTVSATANAADSVYFKSPINFAGTGCKADSVAVTGENSTTLSILFDAYDAGKTSASGLRRTSCNFAVPVHVPQGYQVSVLKADWQGFAEGKTELRRKYFFAGHPNQPWSVSNFNDSNGINYLKTDGRIHRSLSFSKCGKDKILRINSSIRAKGKNSYIAVDTADLSNKVIFRVQWRRCKK